jgi:hypothetical protein
MMANYEATRGLADIDTMVAVCGMAQNSFVFDIESIHSCPRECDSTSQFAGIGRQLNVLPCASFRSLLTRVRHPVRDGLADFVRRIFLDEMDSLDRHLGLCGPVADGIEIGAIAEECTRLCLHKQHRHITRHRPSPCRGRAAAAF